MYEPVKELIKFSIHRPEKMAVGGRLLTMLIRSEFQELNIIGKEAVCSESNEKIRREQINQSLAQH